MTSRERAALILLAVGLVCTATAGYGFGGVWGLLAVVGVILLLIGVLLGLDTEPAPPAALEHDELIDDETEDGVQRG